MQHRAVDFGIDRLPSLLRLVERLRGSRVGVLCHAASVDRQLRHLLDTLGALGITPVVVFAPEHGLGALAQDMVEVADDRDARSGAPVVSLYGPTVDALAPRAEWLERIDLLLVDLVDVGSRYYTFVWTALLALRAAARHQIHTVVLDRPNPIGGEPVQVEGQSQAPGFCSFVGLEPVPIVHALTIGELLALCAVRDGLSLGPDGALGTVPVGGWARRASAHDWDRPFVLPSPNMPTADTAVVYPGGCLLEGTNLSEGRGHTRPFEVVGAPWIKGAELARALAQTKLPGFVARPLEFQPTFHKHASQCCGGVQIHPIDRRAFRPVATYLALVGLALAQDRERFAFRTERYEFVDDIPAFDLLTGSAYARVALQRADDPLEVALAVAAADPTWPEQMRAAQSALEQAREDR